MKGISRRKLANHVADKLAAGENASAVLRELAAYLLDTKRASEAELLVRAIEEALLLRGTALVTTTSARPLSIEATADIKAMVKAKYEHVQQVELREIIDQSVLAGVKITLPDMQLDTTAKTTLEKLTVR